MSTEVVGYTDKAMRDERYARLKQAAQGTRGLAKFSEVELVQEAQSIRVPKYQTRSTGRMRLAYRRVLPGAKSNWRTIWCVAWSG